MEHVKHVKHICTRHIILSVVFAFEAIINRIVSEEIPISILRSVLDREDSIAKLFCILGYLNKPTDLDKGKEPLQSLIELIKIRNWLVHPKVSQYTEASLVPNSSISVLNKNMEVEKVVPWVEVKEGENWPQTQFPKNPFWLTEKHANKAIEILDGVVALVLKTFDKNNEWLNELNIKEKQGESTKIITVDSLWGGYSG